MSLQFQHSLLSTENSIFSEISDAQLLLIIRRTNTTGMTLCEDSIFRPQLCFPHSCVFNAFCELHRCRLRLNRKIIISKEYFEITASAQVSWYIFTILLNDFSFTLPFSFEIRKPVQVVGDEVMLATPVALDDHHTLLVRHFGNELGDARRTQLAQE